MKVSQIIMKLGTLPNIKGFLYIKRGIQCCMNDPESVTNLKKYIYPKVADEYKTTPEAVERAARSAIKTGWHRRDTELAGEIFGNTLQSREDIPSNALYIAAVSEWLNDEK